MDNAEYLEENEKILKLPNICTGSNKREFIPLEQTSLPPISYYSRYPISKQLRSIHLDKRVLNGALKSSIFGYTSKSINFRGFISLSVSLNLLVKCKVRSWFCQCGGDMLDFDGLHGELFLRLSQNRSHMSVDLYIDQMLPKLTKILHQTAKSNCETFTVRMLQEAILLPMFQLHNKYECGQSNYIVLDFTMSNRGYFAKRYTRNSRTDNSRKSIV